MSKEGFQTSVCTILEEIEKSRVQFLQSIPIFSHFSKTRVLNFYLNLKYRKVKRGEVIFREGDTVGDIYIVFKGEFEMAKKLEHED